MAETFNSPDHAYIQHLITTGKLKGSLQSGKIDTNWREESTGRSLLHLAAASNQVETIRFLIGEQRVNLNAQDRQGNTPLHLAITSGHIEVTSIILSHKPNDALCNKDHDPPLHVAIKQGPQGIRMISEFIKHPTINLLVRGHQDSSSLHVIAECNNLKALKLIYREHLARMQQNDNVKFLMKDKYSLTPIHVAACTGTHDVLAYMLSKSSDHKLCVSSMSIDSKTPLHYAAEHGHVECVRVLLEYGADPMAVSGSYHPPPIHSACIHNHLNIVKLMVSILGTEILKSRNLAGGTVLHSGVVSSSSRDLISYLVENKVGINDVDSEGSAPLSLAIDLGSVDAVEELLKLQGNPMIKDKMGLNGLHRAVLSERSEVFKKIASSDAACSMASTADNEGSYPIHHALKLGLHEMVVALLDITSEVFTDSQGNNYLHLAASSSQAQTVSHLLDMPFGQNMLNKANASGSTPLHCAASCPNTTAIKNLLNHGAVINRDKKGQTPFMCACSKGNLDAVKLLYKGSQYQRDWVNHNGSTALHLAVDGEDTGIVTFCLDNGMSITLDNEQNSFLDKILNINNQKLAKVTMSHKRWEECLDMYSPNKLHPILRILDQMPDIYKIILDQCHTKCSLDPTDAGYSEEFNFRCLDVTLNDHSMEQTKIDLSNIHGQEGIPVQRRNWFWKKAKNAPDLFAVLHKLIELRYDSYLQHPVTVEFIRLKWVDFGYQYQTVSVLLPFLLALFFSIFATLIPLPPQDITFISDLESGNASANATSSLNAGSQVMLYTSLILASLDFIFSILQAYIEGFSLILKFNNTSVRIMNDFIASLCTIIFLLSVLIAGLDMALWNSAALALLLSWFSVGFSLQVIHFSNIGVYVTMLISTLRLIAIVTASLSTFLFGFAFAFYILLGSVEELQYETIGLSMFATFHSIIATTDFIGIVDVFQDGGLRFSVLVFLLLVLLIAILPIVFINLLIGLAIGDVNENQREAAFIRQSSEVHSLSVIYQKLIPCYYSKRFSKTNHKYYPNKKNLGTFIIYLFHKSMNRSEASDANKCNTNFQDTIEEKFSEHRKLQYHLHNQLEQKINSLTIELSILAKMKQFEKTINDKLYHLEFLLKNKEN